MQLRQRTAAWICLILVPLILPSYFLFSGGGDLMMVTVISCAGYLLALGLYAGDLDRSPASILQGFFFVLIGTLLAFITWFLIAFSGPGSLFG